MKEGGKGRKRIEMIAQRTAVRTIQKFISLPFQKSPRDLKATCYLLLFAILEWLFHYSRLTIQQYYCTSSYVLSSRLWSFGHFYYGHLLLHSECH